MKLSVETGDLRLIQANISDSSRMKKRFQKFTNLIKNKNDIYKRGKIQGNLTNLILDCCKLS